MDETIVRGLIIGAVFMAIGITAKLAWKLIRSTSEGARRLKWVIAGAGALALIAMFLSANSGDKAFMAGIVAIVAAAIWVVKGFKAKS